MADGDGRAAAQRSPRRSGAPRGAKASRSTASALQKLVQRRAPLYDKSQDGHYNLISALHKSVRGSDPDAALYYLARMLDGGEDPLYIARRADPHGGRGHRPRRPERAGASRSPPRTPTICSARRGRAGACRGRRLPRGRAEIERRLYGLRRGAGAREGERLADAPEAHPECADKAHEAEGYGRATTTTIDADEAFSGQNYFPDEMERQTFYTPTTGGASARSSSGSTAGPSFATSGKAARREIDRDGRA